MIRVLEVKEEIFMTDYPGLDDVSIRLDMHGPGNRIDNINWPEYDYYPEVRFNMAYGKKEIFLKFYVMEEYFKAEKTETNQMVSEDSCVEFFVSPADDHIYYNFEFNAIGTCLLGSGTGRSDNVTAQAKIVSGIRRLASAGDRFQEERAGPVEWTITLAIPFTTFFRHKVEYIKGMSFRANFYKCGDKLSVPHYLTWSPVKTPNPDYHRPEYFGTLKFI
jgi:hypothetical protein